MADKYEIKELEGKYGKIFIGMPRERLFIPAFIDNRDKIFFNTTNSGRFTGYYQAEGHRVDHNRDRIVERFLTVEVNPKPEWLVMIDTDMQHPEDVALRLTSWGKPIVGGLYFHRGDGYEPFMFKDCPRKTDKYGREVRQWMPMKREAYKFLKDNNVIPGTGALVLNHPVGDPLIQCAAVATGAIAIHRSVLEFMPKPIFEYRNFGTSEDLQFCADAQEYGIPVYCDMSTISGHYKFIATGYSEFMETYRVRGVNHTRYNVDEAITMLADYLKVPEDLARSKIMAGSAHLVGDYWKAFFGDTVPTQEMVDAFYKNEYTGQLYLIELIHWNGSPEFETIRAPLMSMRNLNIFELGGGIGTIGIQLALQDNNVVSCEVNPYLLDFCNWYQKKVEDVIDEPLNLKFVSDYDVPDGTIDVAIAFDVFEHLPERTLREALHRIHKMLKPNGHIVHHSPFDQQEYYPLHFNYIDQWEFILRECGFKMLGRNEAVRVEHVDS
jgi:2-polyprenyl-3-methyl-5-hydroxy-6-metoxy-1,4-benzoquinol methylase